MMLHWLQHYGHTADCLMGGGTTRVGDPSGKDESRQLLSDETINENFSKEHPGDILELFAFRR